MINKKFVDNWVSAKNALNVAKAKEMSLRLILVELITEKDTTPKTYHSEERYGKLTATVKTNLNIDKAVYAEIERKLKPNELDCIKMDPKLKLKEFKLLDEKSLLRKAVVETPATPGLEFKPKS